MTQTTTDDQPMPSFQGTIEVFIRTYGPFAFGICTVLIIWYSIMLPELEHSRIDFEKHTTLVQQMTTSLHQQDNIALTLKETAQILDRVTHRLESFDNSQ